MSADAQAPKAREGARAASGPAALAALVRACAAAEVGRRVMLLRVEALPPSLARPHHLRLAHAALDPLLGEERGQWYTLPGGRVAVSWRGEAAAAVSTARTLLAYLLQDTPGAPDPAALAPLYDLPQDGDALLLALGAPVPAAAPVAPPSKPFDVAGLAAAEAQLSGADVSRFARRRTVYERAGGQLIPAWEERRLSLEELGATLAPGRDMRAQPWLLHRLARTLDRRMLALLSAQGELREAGPFGLALTVSAVLGPEFLRFDAALPLHLRGRVVLGLHPADILSDPAAFAFARDFARTRSYRVMLRGVDAALLPALAPERMEVDLVQLRWSPGLAPLGAGELPAAPQGVLLARADEAEALDWGEARGIRLFQGRAAQGRAAQAAA